MRAGLLRETLVFKELEEITSPTGFVKKEYKEVFRCKAYRKKLSSIIDKDGLNAGEEFIGNIAVFQIRYYPVINEDQRVEYQGRIYSITLLDRQRDNTYLITITKMNG